MMTEVIVMPWMIAVGIVILGVAIVLWWLGRRNFQSKIQQLEEMQSTLETEHTSLQAKYDEALHQNEIQRTEISEQKVSLATLNERLEQFSVQRSAIEKQAGELTHALETARGELNSQQRQIIEFETTLTKERQSAAEKLALLEDAKQKLASEFKVLANQIFEEKGRALNAQSRDSLDAVLKPVREQLGDFRKRVDEVHLNDAKDRASLKQHLEQLEHLNRQMSEDALGLTQALKGESKAQGNWGEMILERLLESSGLREGHEFIREQSFNTEEGRRLRPDVVIYMPGDKQVIIDSKVSLTDYERAVSAESDEVRSQAVQAHLRSLKQHIQGLAGKRYDHLPEVNSPDYVLMFMPIEAAYLMAIEADASVFEAAFDSRVAVVTPSTLYATLKLIEHLWRYERQSENVVKLIDRAGKLHDKVADFVKSFEEVGSRLKQAQGAYDTALGRISSGPGNVIRQIDQLGKLAGKTKKELPRHLLEDAALSDQSEAED